MTLIITPVEIMGTIDEELLYAIRAMEVLLESGVGVSEVMRHLADEEYGDLSLVFKEILASIDRGMKQVEAIQKSMVAQKSTGMKKLLSTMALALEEGIDTVDRLRSIADREARQRRVKVEGFVEQLGGTTDQFLIVAILLPLIAVIFGVIAAMMNGIGNIGPQLKLPSFIIPLLFIVSASLMLWMVRNVKRREPVV